MLALGLPALERISAAEPKNWHKKRAVRVANGPSLGRKRPRRASYDGVNHQQHEGKICCVAQEYKGARVVCAVGPKGTALALMSMGRGCQISF